MDAHLHRKASRAVPTSQRALSSGHVIMNILSQGCRFRPSRRLLVVPFASFRSHSYRSALYLSSSGLFLHLADDASPAYSRYCSSIARNDLLQTSQSHEKGSCGSSKHYSSSPDSWFNLIKHSSYCKVDHSRSTAMRACYYRTDMAKPRN